VANKALLVTIGAYPTKPLKGPPFDYVDWNGLVSGAPFNFTMLPALQEAAATKAAIMASVTTLLAGAANGDHLLLYFSGHGTRVDDDNGTHDGVVAYPAASGAPQISDVVFESEFEALVVGSGLRNTTAKLTIVLDCCHAAGIGSPFDIRLMKELDAARFISVDTTGANPIAAGTMSQLVEPHFLAATGKNSAAYEGDVNGRIRGLFSYAFANAVRAAPNNRITHSDAMAAAQAFINPRHADQDVDQFGPRKRAIFLA
jgi:hypothetical protein